MKKIFYFFLFISLFIATKPKPAFAQTYCATEVDFPVCIKLDVPGNTASEPMLDYWPLVKDASWKFDGISKKHNNNIPYKLQVKVENPITYEGQIVTPVDFAKNNDAGYWGPDSNQNLRWLIVNFGQSPDDYMWAKGDKRFDRTSLEFVRRFRYDSLTPEHPPYILMPRILQPNPENDGLKNSFLSRHQYYNCYDNENCVLQPLNQHDSWFIGVTNVQVRLPYNNYQWADAKRIEFVEISLPGGYNDGLTDPYNNDRNFACRMNGNVLYYRGVREDWYFVKNVGLVLILTREVGLEPDNECIYEVARENLSFDNADTYSYLIRKDFNNYDPTWNYSPPPFSTITPTPTPTPTPIPPTATPIPPTSTPIPSSSTPTPIPGDINHDNKVDIQDYNQLLTDFGKTGTPGFVAADINNDGKMDIFDYNILVGNFGKTQ